DRQVLVPRQAQRVPLPAGTYVQRPGPGACRRRKKVGHRAILPGRAADQAGDRILEAPQAQDTPMIEHAAAFLYRFLRKYDIDPDKVTVVLRSSTPRERAKLVAALSMDLKPMSFRPGDMTSADFHNLKLNGISFVLTDLDTSALHPGTP